MSGDFLPKLIVRGRDEFPKGKTSPFVSFDSDLSGEGAWKKKKEKRGGKKMLRLAIFFIFSSDLNVGLFR